MKILTKIILFSTILAFHNAVLFGGKVVVSGDFKNAIGEQVYVFAYADFLSLKETSLAKTIIDQNGHFELTFDINTLQPIIVDIAFYRQFIYVEPFNTYHIQSEKFQVIQNGNPYIPESFIDAKVTSRSLSDSIFRQLEIHISHFLDTAGVKIYSQHRSDLVENFRQNIWKNLPENLTENYKNAIAFRLACLYPNAQLPDGYSSLNEIAIDYNNYEYFRWLEDYLQKQLFKENSLNLQSVITRNLILALNKSDSFHSLQDTLSEILSVRNEAANELYTLVALKILYATPMFSNTKIIADLQQIRDSSSIEIHKLIAQNLLNKFTGLKPGSLVPDVVVKIYKGDSIRMREYCQKPLYIVFARKECRTCLSNLEMLRPLFPNFKDQVNFLAVFTSHDTLADARIVEQMKYPWPSIIAGRNYELLHAFEAYSLPLEMLVSPGCRIAAYPAYQVNEGLEAILRKMTFQSQQTQSLEKSHH